MTPRSPLKDQLALLLLLFGLISSAQQISNDSPSILESGPSQKNPVNSDYEDPAGCFEYTGFVVSKKTGDPIVDAHIEVKSTISGLVTTIRTDLRGYYKVIMPCNDKNKMVFVGKGYSKESRVVRTGAEVKSPSKNNRIYLTPFNSLVDKDGDVAKIKTDEILFKSHKNTSINSDETALEKVLYTMMKFPDIRIKIEPHSNAGSTDISNAVLTYFHAKAARRYLILQGINPDRIESANGYEINSSAKDSTKEVDCEDQESAADPLANFIIVSNE